MNAIILVIPIILIRYGYIRAFSKETSRRADFFPPTEGIERAAFYVYQISLLALFAYLFFLHIQLGTLVNYLGAAIYLVGMLLYMKSIADFSKPHMNGMNKNGVYKHSRNPMYVAFFLYFLGCGLLTGSWVYLAVLCVFQVSVHYLILSEERWCLKEFGEEYRNYMRQVRRYL